MNSEKEKTQKLVYTIEKTMSDHEMVTENTHIVLGLSGGPDSVCLFDVLLKLSTKLKLTIHPVHINHQFRPGAAEADQHYVENLCESRGLVCRSFVFDCNDIAQKLKLTSEEAGRKVRYESFFKVARELEESGVPCSKIAVAVAQNANDQCETILFRILRGTGTDGLAGIAYQRMDEEGYKVIRPLLDVFRSDIENYCESRDLKPKIDNTNEQPIYTRNKIRLQLIPFLRDNFNENIVETVNRLGRIAAEDREYLNSEADRIYQSISTGEGEVIFTENLDNIHPAIRYRIYNIALRKVGLSENLTRAHIEAIEKVRISQNPSASADIGGGFTASKAYDRLVFRAAGAAKEFGQEWQFRIVGRQECSDMSEAAKNENRPFGVFGQELVQFADKLEIRTRKNGDYITVKGGKKKIQDFFVDCKVPRIYRDEILLFTLGNNVLWVMPSPHLSNEVYRLKGRFSADFKANFSDDENLIFLEKKENLW